MKVIPPRRPTLFLRLTLGVLSLAVLAEAKTTIWTGAAGTRLWMDGGNWTGGVVPGSEDIARFESAATVSLDEPAAVGRVEVEAADKNESVVLRGMGRLILAGVDTVIGKPLSLAVKRGMLEIGPNLAIDIQGTRFSAHAGGTLFLRGERVGASKPDLKLAVSQTGTLRLGMRRWDSRLDLDLSTGSTRGLGAKIIDFALPIHVHQIITFGKFKEHDGDPIVIRGFEPGDALCFREDPLRSTDPGKELDLSAVGFEGWGVSSAAEIESTGDLWCLTPKRTSLSKTAVELSSVRTKRISRPQVRLADMRVQTVVPATKRYPRNMGADIVKLHDGRYLLAFSQWLTGATDRDDSRVMGMVSGDAGVTWSGTFPVVTAHGSCKSIRQPSFSAQQRRQAASLRAMPQPADRGLGGHVALPGRSEHHGQRGGMDFARPDYASTTGTTHCAEQSRDSVEYRTAAAAPLDTVALESPRRERERKEHPILVPLFRRRGGNLATEPVDVGRPDEGRHGTLRRRAEGRAAVDADAHTNSSPVCFLFDRWRRHLEPPDRGDATDFTGITGGGPKGPRDRLAHRGLELQQPG